jgi:hypothetical protein
VSRLLLALVAALPLQAQAGRSCEQVKPTPALIVKGMQLAERTSQALDASGARVVLLARAGQDLSKYGLRYSHLGIAYKTDEGPWRVVHKLNQCGTAVAAVYRQGLGEFFLDDLWRYEAAWVVPTPQVQTQLLAALGESPSRIVRLNVAPYSIVSYAWGQKYQQSNQWAIETWPRPWSPPPSTPRAGAGLDAVQGLRADHAEARSAHAPGRPRGLGQHRLRRPSEREAVLPTASRR